MKLWKLLFAGVAVGVIASAFRDFDNETWLVPAGVGGDDEGDAGMEDDDEVEEPILGYDGMDVDTLLDWLDSAELDRGTLLRMHDYEESHLAREPVLTAIDDLLD